MIATKAAPKTVRVALYARVSVAEGLEKEFNSIDAQREACEAYVKSQRGAGWVASPERYDDGGFSGANTDRPAFQRLMADVEAGKVDVVAVYKIDRLSRSLLDFTQLLETFRRRGVAFVSVTQHFDTSTPMGRMVVNLLATFAQFERETTSERVRDKVLATRRRGMWTGGKPPLGYGLREKKLVACAAEAEVVRGIFQLYLEVGSLVGVAQVLGSRGVTNRGRPFTKTSVHALLTNPVYAGRLRCGSDLVPGQHEALVDQATFDEVQALLSRRSVTPRGWAPPRRNGALLRGLLSCACGASMIHHSARGHGRIYRFYVCSKALKHGAKACPGSRVPMGELDAFVVERVRAVARDPRVLEATVAADRVAREARRPELEAEARRLAAERGRVEAERRNIVAAIGSGAAGLVGDLADLDARLADADQRLAHARRDLAALDLGATDPDALRRALAEFEPLWGELAPAERARVLALLLERVTFDAESGEVEIRFRPGAPRLIENTRPAPGASPGGGREDR